MSAIGSYSHNLAKYLTGIIKPYAINEYTVKDSFSFVNELLCYPSVPFMCSFDIVSLFTNIPINETIEICLDKLYKDRLLVENMKRAQLKKLLLYCVKQNHFMFNDTLYDQVDGVSMGSPLGPVLANIFVSHLESNALRDYHGNHPSVHRRYVDDTFLEFNDRDDAELFLDFMNSLHKNIKFPVEIEENNCLPFLDVLITRNDEGNISTSMYRKKTFSGLYMKEDSFVPTSFKHNLIYGLLNRAFKISSSGDIFKQEIKVIKNILISNGFSCNFINKHIKHFLRKKHSSDNNLPSFGPEKKILFLCLPFCGINSSKLKRQLERVIGKIAPWAKLNIIFRPYFRLKILSNLKSPVPLLNKSNVVYKINCNECDEFYIGMTKRRVHIRLKEHKTRHYSAVFKHIHEHKHNIDFEHPKILCNDCNKMRLLVKETLSIIGQSANKSLNVNVKSFECKLW